MRPPRKGPRSVDLGKAGVPRSTMDADSTMPDVEIDLDGVDDPDAGGDRAAAGPVRRSTWPWVWLRARSELRRHPAALIALMGAFLAAGMLVGGVRLAERAGGHASPALRGGVHLVAYLGDGTGVVRARALRETLAALPDVVAARIVTGEEAATRLRARLGDDAALLDGVEDGFLPTSIEVSLHPQPAIDAKVNALAERLRAIDGIAAVDPLVGEEVARLETWLRAAGTLGKGALALAIACAILVLLLAVRVGRKERETEARLLILLGATPTLTRGPAIIAGALAGVTGVVLAFGGLAALFEATVAPALRSLLVAGGIAAGGLPFSTFFPVHEIVAFAVAALLIGALAGARAARPPRLA